MKQRNVKCNKCKRNIKQEFNETTNMFEYAEVFKEKNNKYYCNDCYNS